MVLKCYKRIKINPKVLAIPILTAPIAIRIGIANALGFMSQLYLFHLHPKPYHPS